MDDFSLATQTLFAELIQQTLDAEFTEDFSAAGRFIKRLRKGHYYWYFRTETGGQKEVYVGPVRDPAIHQRVKRFEAIKADYGRRREIVRALLAAGLPRPDALTADVVEALGRAGFFRLRGVLIGTVAYQAYAGVLGIKLPGATLMTQDADFAQFWGIAQAIDDRTAPVLEALQGVDATFRAIPSLDDPLLSARFGNDRGFKVEFLTPNRGSEDHQVGQARMKALTGAAAQPLRHLDFLIHEPERSALLHKGGVAATIPRAERYAVHKLIVAAERQDQVKSAKDIMQAGVLIEALARKRPLELAEAWDIAWGEGPRWREKLEKGRARLNAKAEAALAETLARAKASKARRARGKPG